MKVVDWIKNNKVVMGAVGVAAVAVGVGVAMYTGKLPIPGGAAPEVPSS